MAYPQIADTCLMLKLIEAIEDKEFGMENAKIIALSMCSQLSTEQSNQLTTYLNDLSVITLDDEPTQPPSKKVVIVTSNHHDLRSLTRG